MPERNTGNGMFETGKNYLSIEKEFFEMDEDSKTALIRMEYESPDEILKSSTTSKTPMMTEEFLEEVVGMFDLVPDNYHLALRLVFDEMGGYTKEQMTEILKKNIMLVIKSRNRIAHRHNMLALTMVGIGILLILLFVWISKIWTEESEARSIAEFILEIVATVPFWAAMEIYIIDNSERRRTLMNLRRRFRRIEFVTKDEA